jgi:hypothetical protein
MSLAALGGAALASDGTGRGHYSRGEPCDSCCVVRDNASATTGALLSERLSVAARRVLNASSGQGPRYLAAATSTGRQTVALTYSARPAGIARNYDCTEHA